jgi:hypothetical protein
VLAVAVHATLSVTTSRNDYIGNGATATYSYTFRITASSDLLVTTRSTAGVETTLALTSGYTVTGVGAGTGGTITLTAGNLASGVALTIRRVLPLTQPTDLRNQGPFLAETHETVFDRLTMQSQQQQDELSRSIRVPESISPSAFSTLLPATVAASGGQALIVKTDGTGIDTVPVNPGSIFTSPAITGTVTGGASYEGIVPGLYSNTLAGLNAAYPPGTAGRLARVTDGIRGIWKDTGTAWVSVTGYADVRDFATSGVGTFASRWAGWESSVTALPSGTKIRFPAGYYTFSTNLSFGPNIFVEGHGERQTFLYFTGSSGYAFTFGTTTTTLAYGNGIRGMSIETTNNAASIITAQGTAGFLAENIYWEAVAGTNTSTGIFLDGSNAANIFSRIRNVVSNHTKISYRLGSTGSSFTTSVNFLHATAYGDDIVGSVGLQFDADAGEGSQWIGGNFEHTAIGIKSAGNSVTVIGARFEANTVDVSTEVGASANVFIGCDGLQDWSDFSGNNQVFLGNYYGGSPRTPYTNYLAGATIQNGNHTTNGTATVNGTTDSYRYKATGGTPLVAGDIALSAGWGTTASVSAISGTDQRHRFTITSAGTGQGANPTATLTFKDGTWTAAPFAVCSRNGGDQASVLPTWTTTATTLIITFPGTPTAAQTFSFECVVMG